MKYLLISDIKLPYTAKRVKDAISGEVIARNVAEFNVDYGAFDYKVLRISK